MLQGDHPDKVRSASAAVFPGRPTDAFYREIEAFDAPAGAYSAIQFPGGYVGLGRNKQRRNVVVFSLWDAEEGPAELVETSHIGQPDNRPFPHEGRGFHSELDHQWAPSTRYRIFVNVQHDRGVTVYSAFFGAVGRDQWHLVARLRRPGTHSLGATRGFVEQYNKLNPDCPRTTGFSGAWLRYRSRWAWAHRIRFECEDPQASNVWTAEDLVVIQIQRGLSSERPNRHIFELPRRDSVPRLPE